MKVFSYMFLMVCICMLSAAGIVHAAPSYTGLWVGSVSVDKVSESQIPSNNAFTDPTPVSSPFNFRILLHVDSAGNTRLIKDVIQMWKSGSPGHYALVTDDSLIPANFVCDNLADTEFCHRISTAAYDFDGLHLSMIGTFSLGGLLTGQLILTPENPTNPFLHRFNPEHDNLTEEFKPLKNVAVFDADGNEAKRVCSLTLPRRSCTVDADCPAGEICAVNTPILEVYRVTRDMTLTFSTDPNGSNASPAWGSSLMGGIYQETLKGLHKNTIYVSGTFRLQRVTDIGELNQ
ncbi:MAG: hypothetical protein HZB31_14775 [Nitrospirae bacterium]|nr:hypothetical protein [Nitrospirota bacterium]